MPTTTLPLASPVRSTLAAAAATLAVVGGGYAAVHHRSGTAVAATPPAPLSQRVLTPAELPGFSLLADAAIVRSPAEWAPRDAARLRSIGFLGGISVPLGRPGAAATSTVEQFRTASGAGAELSHQVRPGARTFPVVGVPGARGFTVSTGREVMFTSGAYYYLLSAKGVSQGQLASAARSLYLTVNGCVTRDPAPAGAAHRRQ
jgi:hypothetical protein